ncbi:fimbrial assembly protein PilQ [Cellvibrio zantedeschiae]|uniref:Fimbrial assembly protein PilQ n=1 Tax=Cellvibrio zantedeschiae TaxID=1237077 RepID=A0ABQ3B786_9GAMM|nr:type IV pilus secretin PilQ family protein [Cellvibrio zantedeschiae]GGY78777.1 fimbrial assembly protein PilQ [Cellvibrio zantedeschiae]
MRILFLLGLNMRNKILLILCLLSPLSWGNTISAFNTAELPGERFEVRVQFSETPPDPKGYTIEKPARIVLDFPDSVSELKDRRFPLAFDNGQSAMLLTTDGRTRLILNLNELTSYTTRKDGNSFVIEVGANKAAATNGKSVATKSLDLPVKKAAAAVSGQAAISNIDFRRGQSGEGRIIVTLTDPHVSADLATTGAGVRLSFVNVVTPAELRRRLDVVDFATPVTLVNAAQEGSNSVLNVSAKGEFDYMAYQTDNEYVLSVKPLTEQEKQEKKKDFQFNGEKISLNFQDMEVRAILQILADFSNFNLVASDTVQGRITLRLENVPWDQALALVLKTKGLDKRIDGNVMMIAPAAEIAERERQELSTKKQLEELAPLRTEYLRVRYANAKDMFELFRGKNGGNGSGGGGGSGGSQSTGSVLSERGQAIVDERTNSIIVTDTADRIEQFKRLVDQIDIPIRQVMIEARLVIANSNFRRELGVKWGGITYGLSKNALIEASGSLDGLKSSPGAPYEVLTGKPGKATDMENDHVVNLGVSNPAGSLAIDVLTDNGFLDMELSALENAGYAEIVSQPRVVTSDKQKAVIKSGKQIPFQEASASGATSTSFKDAILKLEVTPQITPDNNVIMDLIIAKDSVGEVTSTGSISIDINQIETKVLVANGSTVVLGGVFGIDANKTDVKVPVLGDIPYLGRLFKRTVRGETKTELLIFITPKIIADKMTN